MPAQCYAPEYITDSSGTWSINWGLVRSILRSNAYNKALIDNSRNNNSSERDWFNPLSWGMPTIVSYDVNWDAVKRQTDADTEAYLLDTMARVDNQSLQQVKMFLRNKLVEGDNYRRTFKSNMQSASRESMRNINRSVENYETAETAAKFVRDASATTLLIGAVFLSGGAAAFALGAGVVLKGVATYQDTGNVGGAIFDANAALVLTLIPMGAAATGAKGAVGLGASTLFLQVQFDVANGFISGKSMEQVAASGGLTIAESQLQNVAKQCLPKTLKNMAVPAKILTQAITSTVTGEVKKSIVDSMASSDKTNMRMNLSNPLQTQAVQCLGSAEYCQSLNMLENAIKKVTCN